MKTADEIMSLDLDAARRLIARQQVRLAEHERSWAGGCGPDAADEADEYLRKARRTKRQVYKALKDRDSFLGK